MKTTLKTLTCLLLLTGLSACGTDRETIVHDRPIVVAPGAAHDTSPDSVESSCTHGYDNRTHQCY